MFRLAEPQNALWTTPAIYERQGQAQHKGKTHYPTDPNLLFLLEASRFEKRTVSTALYNSHVLANSYAQT